MKTAWHAKEVVRDIYTLTDAPTADAFVARRPLAAQTDWWTGSADVLTFVPVEPLASKVRALAQRRKGRDLNDLDVAHEILGLDDTTLAKAAAHYLHHADITPTFFRARLAAHGADFRMLSAHTISR